MKLGILAFIKSLGVFAFIKSLLPLLFYILAVVLLFAALFGKGRWALLFVIFFSPLRDVVEKLQQFPGGNKLMSIIMLAILFGWSLSNSKSNNKIIGSPLINKILLITIFYMFISLQIGNIYLQTDNFFDVSDPRVQDWKNFCLLPLLYFITFNIIHDEKWVWRVFGVMCASMVLMNYHNVHEISSFSSIESRDKMTGTFQYLGPNEVAAFYSQYSILLLGVFFFLNNKTYKLLLLALILVNIYCLIFIYSRGAYLGFAAGLIFLFLIKRKRYLIPLFLVLGLWQVALPHNMVERIESTYNEYGQIDISSADRLELWKISFGLFEKSPVFGIGYGTFRHFHFLGLGDTHNIYVKYLVEQGIIGLCLFLWLLFSFLKEGMRLFRFGSSDINKGLGLGFTVAIITLMVNNFFGDRWTYMQVSCFIWVTAGLVARLNTLNEQAPQPHVKIRAMKTSLPKSRNKIRYYDL